MSFSHTLINGKLLPYQNATLPLTHPSFFTGYGVYESIQVLDGHPFHLTEHLSRLLESAETLEIAMPPLSILSDWAMRLLARLSTQSYALKILVLGKSDTTDRIIAFFPQILPSYPTDYYIFGAKAISFEGKRLLPQCKSLNTLVNHLGRMAAEKVDALEAILTSDGNLCEGARSNLFVVDAKSGRLLTPPAKKTLSGITKEIVMQIMAKSPTPVIETPIPIDLPITEMFITSTSMHIMPITNFDGHPFGDGKVGTVTTSVSQAFENYHKRYYANSPLPHLDNLG